MSFLVINCFHWIGFHIVNTLLEDGHEVDGIDIGSSHNRETFSMFLGRNSLFSLIETDEMNRYDTSFSIGDHELINKVPSKRILKISQNHKLDEKAAANMTIVRSPFLFGEWMPMDEEGMYYNNECISFNSRVFLTKSIYIKDFVDTLLQWIKSGDLPALLDLHSSSDTDHGTKTLENNLYIRDNGPIENKLRTVLKHYHRFRDFY